MFRVLWCVILTWIVFPVEKFMARIEDRFITSDAKWKELSVNSLMHTEYAVCNCNYEKARCDAHMRRKWISVLEPGAVALREDFSCCPELRDEIIRAHLEGIPLPVCECGKQQCVTEDANLAREKNTE